MEKDIGLIKIKSSVQYNFLNAETKASYIQNDASENRQLMYTPKNQGQLGLDISVQQFVFYYRQSIVGSVYINRDNTSYLPSYSPADLGLEWTSKYIEGKQIVAGVKVFNIFNEDYHVISYRPMPRVHVLFNLKINLKQQ
jgi:outer membrane cobalamin receptor